MERINYLECDFCSWLVYNSKGDSIPCPHCNKGVLRSVIELRGKALEGDQPFRFDTDLAMALAESAGRDVTVLVRVGVVHDEDGAQAQRK